MIRHDKFNYVLPNAMRRNGIDMWIVIDHGRGTEPMMLDFGIETAYGQGIYIFYDGGGDHIERLCLGGPGSSKLSDICGVYDEIKGKADLRSIVFDRDPKRIALNYLDPYMIGEGIYNADGLSTTDYKFLVKELGEKYAKRFVSAQDLIADFRGEHVAGEIIEFAKVAQITQRELERAFSNEVITPGKTTQFEVELWLEERREELGLRRTWFPGVGFPESGYRDYQSMGKGTGPERVIQRGDILSVDWGLNRNHFSTDMKRYAYVLREEELEAPAGILKAFEEAKKVREIIRKSVRSGRTGREQLDELKQIIRDAGYVYTEEERASEVPGIEVNVGMHGMGNIAHDVAAGLAEFSPELTEYEIRPNAILALEFRVFTPSEEWGGKKIPVSIEENVLITERGLEWLHPPQNRVLLIR
jgi:Xaa-Pro aminopeptidase